jgi:hypothetical protein
MKLLITDLIGIQSSHRPNFFSDIINAGKVDGKFLIIDEKTYESLCKRPPAPIRLSNSFAPGNMLAKLIKQILKDKVPASCIACSDRAKQMNTWGWLGCWKNRELIIQWLGEEARKLGHEVNDNTVRDLVFAAIKARMKD